ncbi:MAG: phosphoribosylanthranilate isomerase [Pseudomonadota bacterium]
MLEPIRVKICGLTRPQDALAADSAGARYIGLVFFPKSPRNVDFDTASAIAAQVPVGICKVALTVNATDTTLDDLLRNVPIDMVQLHGSEPPERVAEVRTKFGLPVMKAVGIATVDDLGAIAAYEAVADQILVDTKPPKDASRPGGNGLVFDWQLLAGRRWQKPWMLAGGLTKDNVAKAIRVSGANQVDLSSAVETAPGQKDATLMREFVSAAQASQHDMV